jgi:hypothetical protein
MENEERHLPEKGCWRRNDIHGFSVSRVEYYYFFKHRSGTPVLESCYCKDIYVDSNSRNDDEGKSEQTSYHN